MPKRLLPSPVPMSWLLKPKIPGATAKAQAMPKRLLPSPVPMSPLFEPKIPGATAKSSARRRRRNTVYAPEASREEVRGDLSEEVQEDSDAVSPMYEASTNALVIVPAMRMAKVHAEDENEVATWTRSRSLDDLCDDLCYKMAWFPAICNDFQGGLSQKMPELANWSGHDTDQFDPLLQEHQDASDAVLSISKAPATDPDVVDMDAAQESQGGNEEAVWCWLKGLDGRGSMLKYFSKIRDKFQCNFWQIAAAKLPKFACANRRYQIAQIDPLFFDTLGIVYIGEKMLFAKAILKLHLRLLPPPPPPPRPCRPRGKAVLAARLG